MTRTALAGHVTGPAGGPFREDREPCRECARREAEERMRQAAKNRQPRDWTWAWIAGIAVAIICFFFSMFYDLTCGDRSKECYFVSEHRDFTGHVYKTIEHGFSERGREDLRSFPSVAEAEAFLAEKKAKMCP